jgi:hypothetical protein
VKNRDERTFLTKNDKIIKNKGMHVKELHKSRSSSNNIRIASSSKANGRTNYKKYRNYYSLIEQ